MKSLYILLILAIYGFLFIGLTKGDNENITERAAIVLYHVTMYHITLIQLLTVIVLKIFRE